MSFFFFGRFELIYFYIYTYVWEYKLKIRANSVAYLSTRTNSLNSNFKCCNGTRQIHGMYGIYGSFRHIGFERANWGCELLNVHIHAILTVSTVKYGAGDDGYHAKAFERVYPWYWEKKRGRKNREEKYSRLRLISNFLHYTNRHLFQYKRTHEYTAHTT